MKSQRPRCLFDQPNITDTMHAYRAEKLQNDKLFVQTFDRPSLNSRKPFSKFFRRERFTDRMTQCTSSGCFSYRAIS